MTKDYQTNGADAATVELELPEAVTVAMTELAGAMKEGLLAMAVGAGLQVMQTMMDEDVLRLCGPKGKHDPQRTAVRHGDDDGAVTLGGRRVPMRRPRVRTADRTAEVSVPSYEVFSGTEVLDALALERMLAKLSCRRYPIGLEPVGTEVEARATGTSKSTISRRFVRSTERALDELMSVDLAELDLVALMIDGVNFGEHTCVVALGIDIDGTKHPLAVEEGDTENATVVRDLLAGLRERGLDVTRPILVVIDGAKALRSAVTAVFDHPVIQRCQLHKIRNVEAKLPKRLRATVASKMRVIYQSDNVLRAESDLRAMAADLRKSHPGAAGSLLEGLEETLTVVRLGLPPLLRSTVRSTNAIESMIEISRDHSRNVKRWRDGQMALRWCAAGMVEATKQFRRVKGFLHLRALRAALDATVGVTLQEYNEEEDAA
ncbi:MAG: IS256 family transposase [Haloechinothrix sp.]